MGTINILDSATIDKIAAGEVVERPSAVVKELTENALDAGASAITIEIKDGGTSFIRITDNGEGIARSEIKKAFMRHATSKIKSIDDLLNVSTLGFRGEALSSISSVAKVELLTKTKDDFLGVRYVIEGGKECVFDDAGVPDGTTIIVKDLFYNIPARKKFLKSNQTEASYITELVEHMILSNPQVAFKYIINGNTKLQSAGNNDIRDCIYTVYGRDIASNIINIEADRDDISIRGYIGKPELSRGTKNLLIYFVNGRFIKSSIIDHAITEAYKNYMMLHKFPVVFLYFDIPRYLIDVNVHPAKREIRFIEGEALKYFIEESVKAALSDKELIPEVSAKTDSDNTVHGYLHHADIAKENANPEPFEILKISEKNTSSERPFIDTDTDVSVAERRVFNYAKDIIPAGISNNTDDDNCNDSDFLNTDDTENTRQLSLFEDKFISEAAVKKHKIIGQLFNTYWLIEYDSKLYIIDQHAAHEKVNYERLIKKLRNNENTSQMIYPPVIVTLTNSEAEIFKKYEESFSAVGFTCEHFGGNEYSISAVPTELLSQNPRDYFMDVIDDLSEGRISRETDAVNLRIATMACKASVKANMQLSVAEADALISELLTLDNPYNCPHGRPVIVSYSKYEIEKMFKRVVN